jgi:hypothetical protein
VVDFTQELRSLNFLERGRHVIKRLRVERDPRLGQLRLPSYAGDSVQIVASLFNSIGILVAFKVIDRRIAISIFGPRAGRAWEALEPFIDRSDGSGAIRITCRALSTSSPLYAREGRRK